MIIYVSGPITGVSYYEGIFDRAAKQIRAMGHTVINPAELGQAVLGELTHEQWMQIDMDIIKMCDAVYAMPGWAQSKGASEEVRLALWRGMKVFDRLSDIPRGDENELG